LQNGWFPTVILNAFSVLAAFVALLRLLGGILVVVAGIAAVRKLRAGPTGEEGEERFYLLFSLCAVLVGLSVLSWPLFYMVLDSYVPEWPGFICIQGVTRVGTRSLGAAGYLPGLVRFLEVAKPLVVFVGGGYLVLHLLNRRTATGALTGRVTGLLLLCGAVAAADGAAEGAYLLIPKQERFLAAGCCGVRAESAALAASPAPAASAADTTALTWAFFGLSAGLVVALSLVLRRPRAPLLGLLAAGAALSLPLGLAFLVAVAAPAFLRLPHHACAYCLVHGVLEALLGVALYVAAAFAAGWAFVGATVGRAAGEEAVRGIATPLLRFARFGYLGAALMAGVGVAVL
jgi:hypothetical protein